MRANKRATCLALFLGICLACEGQDLSTLFFGYDKKLDYIGQLNYNGKHRNGFGMARWGKSVVYVGDFLEDEASGRGMLISQDKKGISNVNGAVFYVGGWRDGKKYGRGVCYDASGKVILNGIFANDKVIEVLDEDDSNLHFGIKEIGDEVYVGEMTGNVRDGFGLTLLQSGEYALGSMTKGVRQGVG